MVASHIPPSSAGTLDVVMDVLAPLATWLVRSGVGHAEFARASKQVFFEAALAEQARTGVKATDSALSLLSGLHRKDIKALRAAEPAPAAEKAARGPSLANQVVTRWLSLRWPAQIPFAAERKRTFERLVLDISRDVHPRTILNELVRLGLVAPTDQGREVRLLRTSFVPTRDVAQAQALLRDNLSDHIRAGVHNLTMAHQGQFLEQSVFADGLTPDSIALLQQHTNALWRTVLSQTAQRATALCQTDADKPAPCRMRVGMFFYSEPTS